MPIPGALDREREFFVDNSDSYNGVKDDNISTPQNEAAKSLDAANKSLQALLNSDAIVTESDLLPILNKLSESVDSLRKEFIPEITPPTVSLGNSSEVTSISGVIGAMERLENGINNKNLTTASLGDIMTLVSFMLLTSAQDQKEAQMDMRRLNKDIASATAIISFELKMQAAKDTKEAAKLEAWGQMVEGIASVASGIASLATLGIGSINIGKKSASGKIDADAAKTQHQNVATIARDVQTMIDGVGKMISAGLKMDVAAKRYSAEKAKINAEVADSFKQASLENASIFLQAINAIQQFINNIISFLQQILRNLIEAINAIRGNI